MLPPSHSPACSTQTSHSRALFPSPSKSARRRADRTSGEGWTYADGKLTLGAGHAFTFTGHALNVSSENLLRNKGVIEDGTFVDASQTSGFAVRNEAGGVIRGGAFTASIGNAGIIAGGTFNSDPNDPTNRT